MIDPNTVTVKAARNSFVRLLDSIPKGKYAKVQEDAERVEIMLGQQARLLGGIRKYILDNAGNAVDLGGEESPFVHAIDKLLEREKPKDKPTV